MRVLHLTAGNLYGGIETFLVTLARSRHLAPDMEPHFGLCFPGRLRDELNAAGVPTYDLGPVKLSRPWTTWSARQRLKKRVRETRFDAVVTHASWPHVVFAPAVRRSGALLVNAVHDNLSQPSWLDREAAKTPPDLIVTSSRFTATAATKLFSTAQTKIIPYPVAISTVTDRAGVRLEVRNALGTRPDTVVILQASRLEEWKGHEVHLDALARLSALQGWEAWIAGGVQKKGEDNYLASLREKVEKARIGDRVRFLGQRSDVPRLMAAADVYCQPNTGPEPFGLAFVEALQSGLPVVTSGCGGAAEIVDETCGMLTPLGNVDAVAKALGNLIENPDRRAELGANGPHRAAELCDTRQQLNQLAEWLGTASRSPQSIASMR